MSGGSRTARPAVPPDIPVRTRGRGGLVLRHPEAAFVPRPGEQEGRARESFGAIQGWLNQEARREPESSPTLTDVIESPRRLRKGRGVLPRTSTRIVPLSPASSSATRHHRAVAVAVGKPQEQVAEGRDAGLGGRLGELRADAGERGRRTTSTHVGRGQWTAASRNSTSAMAPRRPRSGARAAYWAASSHHQLGCPPSCVSISTPSGTWVSISSSGIGASSPAITVTISAPSARAPIVAARVVPAPPQAMISPAAKPTASPLRKRPWGSSRAAAATPPLAMPSSAASSRSAFSAAGRLGVELDQDQQALLLRGGADHPGRLLGELAGALGGHDHVCGAGQDEDSPPPEPRGSRRAARRWTG